MPVSILTSPSCFTQEKAIVSRQIYFSWIHNLQVNGPGHDAHCFSCQMYEFSGFQQFPGNWWNYSNPYQLWFKSVSLYKYLIKLPSLICKCIHKNSTYRTVTWVCVGTWACWAVGRKWYESNLSELNWRFRFIRRRQHSVLPSLVFHNVIW